MIESKIMDEIRVLFSVLDRAVYGFIQIFYDVMLGLSKISILDIDQINDFASKIYALLAIFMLFKITFSLINYLVNPEKVFDTTKGIQKILVNVVIVLGMIIIAPTAFTKLYQFQNAIIDDDLIPKILMGDIVEDDKIIVSDLCSGEGVPTAEVKGEGRKFAFIIFKTFYQPEWARSKPGMSYEEYMALSIDDKKEVSEEWREEDNSDAEAYCQSDSVGTLLSHKILTSAPKNFTDMYLIDYQLFISTAIGIVFLGFIISFCFDIAVRSVRLAFLQLIAPIPIVSYIDPNSGKNGMFKKWLSDVGKTWISLFIRLISIYFAIYLISLVSGSMGKFKDINGNPLILSYSPIVNIFLMVGILMFAKKIPSLIEGILGIKLDGKFEMNPLKKIANDAMGGKLMAGAATGALGAAGVLAMNKMKGKNWRDSFDASKNAFRTGYKSPGTMAGYNEGVKQLRTEKEEASKAKKELAKYNEQRKKGQDLFNRTIKRNADGSLATTTKRVMGADGVMREVTQYDTDDSLIFKNDDYRASYKRVDDLKKSKLAAEAVARQKEKAYEYAVNEHGADSTEARRAHEEKIAADKMLASSTKAYDQATKEHDAMKKMSQYKDDAEAEEMLSYYKSTNPDAIYPQGSSSQTGTVVSSGNNNSGTGGSSNGSGDGNNNGNNSDDSSDDDSEGPPPSPGFESIDQEQDIYDEMYEQLFGNTDEEPIEEYTEQDEDTIDEFYENIFEEQREETEEYKSEMEKFKRYFESQKEQQKEPEVTSVPPVYESSKEDEPEDIFEQFYGEDYDSNPITRQIEEDKEN